MVARNTGQERKFWCLTAPKRYIYGWFDSRKKAKMCDVPAYYIRLITPVLFKGAIRKNLTLKSTSMFKSVYTTWRAGQIHINCDMLYPCWENLSENSSIFLTSEWNVRALFKTHPRQRNEKQNMPTVCAYRAKTMHAVERTSEGTVTLDQSCWNNQR